MTRRYGFDIEVDAIFYLAFIFEFDVGENFIETDSFLPSKQEREYLTKNCILLRIYIV